MTGPGGTTFRAVLLSGALLALAACDESGGFSLGNGGAAASGQPAESRSVQLVERDVEAPEVFQVTEPGLWDGRPSLGGVWVAHPDVRDPERVIIRNPSNGNFVIGALFRRERENPGPALQVSSDAAATLELLAGAPTTLQVTALRREEVSEPQAEAVSDFDAPSEIAAAPLDGEAASDDPAAIATAALDAIEASPAPAAAPAPAAPAPQASGGLDTPYIQLGIFSVEANATGTADRMRANGIVPTVLEQTSQGRTFWRVIVGPATSVAERAELLDRVKAMGFADAYFVRN